MTLAQQDTLRNAATKAASSNISASSFATSRAYSASAPATDSGGIAVACSANFAEITFFGAGSDGNTFDARVTRVKKLLRSTATNYVGLAAKTVTCTMGATTGVSGGILGTSDRLVDTITESSGSTEAGFVSIVPATAVAAKDATGENGIAQLVVDCRGADYLWIDFDMVTATSGNCLISFF